LRPAKQPRCSVASTGEDIPSGHSLRARMLILEVAAGAICSKMLTCCQKDAKAGLYASAMAGYVKWLAPCIERIKASLREDVEGLRSKVVGCDSHARTSDTVANLAVGLRYFIAFARDAGALTEAEGDKLWQRGWKALLMAGKGQADHQAAADPCQRFIDLLLSAISSGQAHLAGPDGNAPENPNAWGWRHGGNIDIDFRPMGARVGWVEGGDVYLDPDASYRVVTASVGQHEGLGVSARTLRKRLSERGMLLRVEQDRLTVLRKLEGRERDVLHMAGGLLSGRTGFSGYSRSDRSIDPASRVRTPKTYPENIPSPPVFGVQNRGADPSSGVENEDEPRKPRIPRLLRDIPPCPAHNRTRRETTGGNGD